MEVCAVQTFTSESTPRPLFLTPPLSLSLVHESLKMRPTVQPLTLDKAPTCGTYSRVVLVVGTVDVRDESGK